MRNGTATQTKPGFLHVADVAHRADVTAATVRYYTRVGLLHPHREPDNHYRVFNHDDLHRVMFTRQAQALGLTIGDVKEILEVVEEGESPCAQVRAMVTKRLTRIRSQIDELRATEARIQRAMSAWNDLSNIETLSDEFCPLIERIDATSQAQHCNGSHSKTCHE